ncbi:MAG: hypothetical protein JWP18_600, partial [Solirubrobacterales bacterium]|nr:hypothetical protein [Solirubrobacterales bacterium]
MKYRMLIHEGDTPTPQTESWAAVARRRA